MIGEVSAIFYLVAAFSILLFITGFFCILVTFNLLRVLIGIEILIKGATLLIIAMGYISGNIALAQEIVLTVIVIEVVVMVVAAGIVIGFHRQYDSINVKLTRKLKG